MASNSANRLVIAVTVASRSPLRPETSFFGTFSAGEAGKVKGNLFYFPFQIASTRTLLLVRMKRVSLMRQSIGICRWRRRIASLQWFPLVDRNHTPKPNTGTVSELRVILHSSIDFSNNISTYEGLLSYFFIQFLE